jgi:hypothetical protein
MDRVIKSRKVRWAHYVVCMEEITQPCIKKLKNLKRKDHFGDKDVDKKIILKMYFKNIYFEVYFKVHLSLQLFKKITEK